MYQLLVYNYKYAITAVIKWQANGKCFVEKKHGVVYLIILLKLHRKQNFGRINSKYILCFTWVNNLSVY